MEVIHQEKNGKLYDATLHEWIVRNSMELCFQEQVLYHKEGMMKRMAFCIVMGIFIVSYVFASDFSPTLLKLSAPLDLVSYNFDGSTLSIPLTVSGKPGSAVLLIFTKGQAQNISKVQNGFLGWHYVNKIDTCIYVSHQTQLSIGSNVMTWNGKDSDGGTVPAGEYTYYIWAFDNVSQKIAMTRQLGMWAWAHHTVLTTEENGSPLTKPVVYGCIDGGSWYEKTETQQRADYKWVVGGDPDDASLLESCTTTVWTDYGGIAIQPDNHNYYFKETYNNNGLEIVRKLKWVPNGVAILQTDWGDNGEFSYSGSWAPGAVELPGVINDDNYLFAVKGDYFDNDIESEIIYIDITTGTEDRRLDLAKWYIDLNDAEKGGQATAGPTSIRIVDGKMVTNCHSSCMNLLLDVYYEDSDEAVLWVNQNGDYTGDHNFEETSPRPWVCNDWNVAPYKYNITMDANLFSAFPSFDLGAVSFGLFAPDGTGLNYFAFAGETAEQKYGIEFIDYNSAFDGIYTTNVSSKEDTFGWFFIAHDSIKGTITNKVDVESDAPSAFSVAQNTPNPFNPATTISFSIPEAGTVSIDVFNVSGQKAATIAHEFMGAGSHSVIWDASGFSAGVYFYTVKSGRISRTMKMTLLK